MDGSGIYDDLNECEAICNSVIEDVGTVLTTPVLTQWMVREYMMI